MIKNTNNSPSLFSNLSDMLNQSHPLYRLANQIDWGKFETAFQPLYCQDDNFYHPEADGGISVLDDTLSIDWRIPTEHANLSEKDTKHAILKDFDSPFDINVDLYKISLVSR